MTSEVQRFDADNPPPADWWSDTKPPSLDVVRDSYTPIVGANALADLTAALGDLDAALQETDATVADATRYLVESLAHTDLVSIVALVQDIRRRLALVESYVARKAGHLAVEVEGPREGYLPDGRQYTLKRGTERKTWDHAGWQQDVRAKVTDVVCSLLPETLVDPGSGEALNVRPMVLEAITQAQAVHGAQAPKVTALKGLGLTANDYCEHAPGPWGVRVIAPSESTGTTTSSGEPKS